MEIVLWIALAIFVVISLIALMSKNSKESSEYSARRKILDQTIKKIQQENVDYGLILERRLEAEQNMHLINSDGMHNSDIFYDCIKDIHYIISNKHEHQRVTENEPAPLTEKELKNEKLVMLWENCMEVRDKILKESFFSLSPSIMELAKVFDSRKSSLDAARL